MFNIGPYQKHRVWHMSALFPKLKEKKSIIIIFFFSESFASSFEQISRDWTS